MKKKLFQALFFSLILLAFSCSKDDDEPGVLGGNQSPIGQSGTTISSTSSTVAGVSNFSAEVTSLSGGISSFTAQATVDNPYLKNLVSNIPGVTVDGNTVTATGVKFKVTTDGVEFLTGPTAGIWVKYGSSVGDTYPVGSSGQVRTVVSKSSSDDYNYGFYMIKVIKVEENTGYLKNSGVSKITYIANHRFGLVGVIFNFDDESTAKFPIYCSAENP